MREHFARYGLKLMMPTLNSEMRGPPVREEAIGSNVTCHDLPVCSSLELSWKHYFKLEVSGVYSGLLDFVLRNLRALTPCDPCNGAVIG